MEKSHTNDLKILFIFFDPFKTRVAFRVVCKKLSTLSFSKIFQAYFSLEMSTLLKMLNN